MPAPIHIHVGAMKTGTTYVQDMLRANRDNLEATGWLYPSFRAQVKAVRDLHEMSSDPARRATEVGRWDALRDTMAAHDGRGVVLSMEFFSFLGRERIRQLRRSIGHRDIHAIVTMRDTLATLPGWWQTSCRNNGTMRWSEYLARVTAPGDPETALVRRHRTQSDIGSIVKVWSGVLGADNVTVVVTPASGADPRELWRRFATAVGLDPDVAGNDAGRSNQSLGQASSDLLRQLNVVIGHISHRDRQPIVTNALADGLSPRRRRESRPALSGQAVGWALERNAQFCSDIRAAGVRVVGDLDSLPTPDGAAAQRVDPSLPLDPPQDEVVDAALDAMATIVAHTRELRDRLVSSGQDALPVPEVHDWATRWDASDDAHGRALLDLWMWTELAVSHTARLRALDDA